MPPGCGEPVELLEVSCGSGDLLPESELLTETHPHDTAPVRRDSKKAVDVVLLSADDLIFETTRNAIGEPHRVWRAQTAEDAIDQLVSGRCGVLVIDLGTSSLEPVGLVRHVTGQFPDVVVVATGRQTDATLLGSTISEGLVYRFMHKPLSPNRAGMFLDHALRAHAERREQSGIVQALLPTVTQLPPRVERRYWYGAAAGLLVLIAALVVYLVQREPSAETPVAELPPQGAGVPPEILLPRAAAALQAGRLEAPADDNALDLYRDVLLAQPNDSAAREGLERTTELVLATAHAESVAGRGDEARRLVRRVLSVDPANPLGLAMQARLETPPPIDTTAAPEEPTEGFMTLLRREFSSARRTTPAPAPTARSAAQARQPAAIEARASPTETAPAPGGGPLAVPAPDQSPLPAQAGTASPEAVTAATEAASPAAARPQSAPAADPAGSGPSLVPLREFSRVSMTQPDYPDDARRKGTEGWVRLEFTVNERGQVRDIVVVAAEPRGVFDDAASAALARWRFRPPVAADGRPVPLRTSVQLRFELED
jgi:protein TonB